MARVPASLKLLLLTVAVSCANNERMPLHFLYITSDGPSYNSTGAIPAVDIALEKINRDSTLLPGYTLNYTEPLDSKCNRSRSLNVFFGEMRREHPLQYIAVVGCGCSIATEPVAEVSHYYNIPMISFASSAKLLRDRNRFLSYFRTDPSEEYFSPGLAGIVRYYGWRQIAIITQTESLFVDTQEELKVLLDGVAMTTMQFDTEEGPLSIDNLFITENDVRVFILNMYANNARAVLCQAFHREMYHPGYVWITPGWYGNGWWRLDEAPGGSINCTGREMQRALDRSLAVLQYPIVDREAITDSGITTEEFLTKYDNRVKQSNFVPSITASLAYDAIWALAVALNTTMHMISNDVINNTGCEEMDGPLVPFENFTYRNRKLWCLFHNNLQRTDFLGVSGDVMFDEHGTRFESSVRIEQYRESNGDLVITPIAHLTNSSTLVYSDNESNSTVWPGGIPPDGIPLLVITTVSTPLTVTYDLFAAAGLTFALMCLGFNIAFRKRKVVRLTSPNLNYLIIAGALLLYVSVVFIVTPTLVEETATIYCNVQVLVFSAGNTLCFAVVLAKIWRVYYIFNHLSPSKKPTPPKDWLLFVITFALVGIDMIILLIPMAIDTFRLRASPRLNQEQPPGTNEDGIKEEYHFYYCSSSSSLIWLGISYAYKLLLQLTAVYFAFKTRKVKIKPLKDSKEIAIIIYITSLILVVSVAAAFAVADRYLHVYVVIVGAGRLITPTIILGLVFVPKMLALYHDPQGKLIFVAGSMDQGKSGLVSDTSLSQKVHTLEKKIMELETKLREYQEAESLGTILVPPQPEAIFSAVNISPVSVDTKDSTDSNHKSPNTSVGSE